MRRKKTSYALLLVVLLATLLPVGGVVALSTEPVPPADFFQLPWEQGLTWYAIDGIDNGHKRPLSSSHHYSVGGAIDFAPRVRMYKGEDTSNFWVTAAGPGTVVATSTCHVILDHGNGWVTQYQFLGNIQVGLGQSVERNQRLGIIADGIRYKFCLGSVDPDIPHLHFMLRPTMLGATFAGWEINYYSFFSSTTFTKDGLTVGLYKPLLNTFGSSSSTPTPTPSSTPPTSEFTPTPTHSLTPSPTEITPTPNGPHGSTDVDKPDIDVGETAVVTVRLNNVPPEGYSSAEFTCTYDPAVLEVSNITATDLFGTDPAVAMQGPQNGEFIVAIAGSHGQKATTSGVAFTFNVTGLQAGQTTVECKVRVNTGNNVLTDLPSIGTVITVHGMAATSTPTFTSTSDSPTLPSFTLTPTSQVDTWLTFTNLTYGFQFKYPPQGQIGGNGNDNFTRIDLPFVPGTNLTEKYLEVIVVENANPCESPLASESILETSEMIIVNGISFLKQTGQDGTAGHINKWNAYSTIRDNVCVSLDFILRAANPSVYSTPPPLYDEAAESAVFAQMVETFTWLAPVPTATPTTSQYGIITGQVFAGKPVTIDLLNMDGSTAATVSANTDGTFTLAAPAGTYTAVASSNGFLKAQASSVTLTDGISTTLPLIPLPAGDIDGNNVIDQFDAMSIGMNYNAAEPSVADLNNDGIINVLDLELLAGNYRKTGPIVWQ
ncbi:MAG TPA: cohesin domain-containing protein [Anaerolineales bacterium]|nr:cohesin domain-containing protein [Anaerolineales bacterium]